MTGLDPTALSVVALAAAFRNGSLTASRILEAFLDRIRAIDHRLCSFVEVTAREARLDAAQQDRLFATGRDPGPLAGVPIAYKDNLLRRGHFATAASRMLEGHVALQTATVLARLEQAGALLIGRTNMDEFGMGSTTSTSVYGLTKNPWLPDRSPGGSSGGSAAAVAARLVPAALGSDTGGSVRQPAAFCGVVGLRPTQGRISRQGLIAFASSLDTVGLFAHRVADLRLLLSVAGAEDPTDPTSRALPPVPAVPAPQLAGEGTGRLRLGVPRALFEGLEDPVRHVLQSALSRAIDAGATVVEVELTEQRRWLPTYQIESAAEAMSNLARHDGLRFGYSSQRRPEDTVEDLVARSRSEGLGEEVKLRILLGTHFLSDPAGLELLQRAVAARKRIRLDLQAALQQCDLLWLPCTGTTAFATDMIEQDAESLHDADRYLIGPALAGLPALALPCGLARDGLPVAVQLVGQAGSEALLFDLAERLEQVFPQVPWPDPPADVVGADTGWPGLEMLSRR